MPKIAFLICQGALWGSLLCGHLPNENRLTAGQEQWGAVKGRIIWGGEKGPAANEKITESWVINKDNKGVKGVFVCLADSAKPHDSKPIRTHPTLKQKEIDPLDLDLSECRFEPSVIALRDGQLLVIKNSSKIAHNLVFVFGRDSPNLGKGFGPTQQFPLAIKFKADESPIILDCSIHPSMRAWIRVFSHPYFAITDADGAFQFKEAPAGRCRLMIWHPAAGWKGGMKGKDGEIIEIPGGGINLLGDIRFPPP